MGDGMNGENSGGLFWEVEVYDKNGNLIEKKKGRGNCILYNLMRLLSAMRNPSDYNNSWQVINTLGNSASISKVVFDTTNCSWLAPEGADSYGIVVGTGTTSVSLDDYNLASQIKNGTGAGQLKYGATEKYDYSEQGSNVVDLGVKRSFTNNSGSSITINEIGLIAMVGDGNLNYYVLLMRDVISATTVPDGGVVTVTYYVRFNG